MKFIGILLCALIMAGCASIRSYKLTDNKTETVEVEGIAPWRGDKIESSKVALENAFKRAIEEVVGVFVKAHTVTKKAILINETIITDAAGYIENYRIIDEGRKDIYYFVKISAKVNLAKLFWKIGSKHINVKITTPDSTKRINTLKRRIMKLHSVTYIDINRFDKDEVLMQISTVGSNASEIAGIIDKSPYFRVTDYDNDTIRVKGKKEATSLKLKGFGEPFKAIGDVCYNTLKLPLDIVNDFFAPAPLYNIPKGSIEVISYNQTLQQGYYGKNLYISGVVRNSTSRSVYSVQVTAIGLSDTGLPIATAYAYTSPSSLASGQYANFSISINQQAAYIRSVTFQTQWYWGYF